MYGPSATEMFTAKSGLQYSSLVGAVVQRLDNTWTRPSLTVAHSAPSASVADASGCRPALLTTVAGLVGHIFIGEF